MLAIIIRTDIAVDVSIKSIAQKDIDFEELFLYTKHIGLYKKFGWEFISEIDTYKEESRIERLYRLDLT